MRKGMQGVKEKNIFIVVHEFRLFFVMLIMLFHSGVFGSSTGISKRSIVYFAPYSFYPDTYGNSYLNALSGKERYALVKLWFTVDSASGDHSEMGNKIWKMLTSVSPYFFNDSLSYYACYMDSLGAEWKSVQIEPELWFPEHLGRTELSEDTVIYLILPPKGNKTENKRMPLFYTGIPKKVGKLGKTMPQRAFKLDLQDTHTANSEGAIFHYKVPPGSNIKQLSKGRLPGNHGDSENVLWAVMATGDTIVVLKEHSEYSGRIDVLGYVDCNGDGLWDILVDTAGDKMSLLLYVQGNKKFESVPLR